MLLIPQWLRLSDLHNEDSRFRTSGCSLTSYPGHNSVPRMLGRGKEGNNWSTIVHVDKRLLFWFIFPCIVVPGLKMTKKGNDDVPLTPPPSSGPVSVLRRALPHLSPWTEQIRVVL